MVDGDLQESLQPFVAYGYCLSEHVICMAYHSSRKGRLSMALFLFQSSLLRLGCWIFVHAIFPIGNLEKKKFQFACLFLVDKLQFFV